MKKVFGFLAILIIASMVMVGCSNPSAEDDTQAKIGVHFTRVEKVETESWWRKQPGKIHENSITTPDFTVRNNIITFNKSGKCVIYALHEPGDGNKAAKKIEVNGKAGQRFDIKMSYVNSHKRTTTAHWHKYKCSYVGEEEKKVDLGFIGYYLFEGNVLSTSIHWQQLEEGMTIDWAAVDAAYDAWLAQGGLAPNRTDGWLTSGSGSYEFADYDPIGFNDFGEFQLENYYKAFYVDPGYLLPSNNVTVKLCFYAFLDNAWWYGLNYFEEHEFGEVSPDWNNVFDSYANQSNVTPGWFDPDRVLGWQSSGIVSQYFDGARPTITLDEGMLEGVTLADDILVIVLDPVLAAPEIVIPPKEETPEFSVKIFKPQTGSQNKVYINDVFVDEMKVETKVFDFEGYKIQITLNSRGNGNNTWIYDFTMVVLQ